MRVSALLDPDAEGLVTENGNVIGEVTLSGTLELVLFEGIFGGLMAGLLWVLVREWLPRGAVRFALAGAIAALLGSFLVVSAENRDFGALRPPAANVSVFIAIVGLTGCGAAALDTRLDKALPSTRKTALLLGVLAVVGGVLTIPLIAQAFLSEDFCGCQNPPRLAAPFIVLTAAASVLSWRRWLRPNDVRSEPRWLRPMGIAGILGACLFAGIDLAGEVREIVN
jgi:hypothetical protein